MAACDGKAGTGGKLVSMFRKLVLTIAFGILGACATTAPTDYPKTPSVALQDTQDTALGKRVIELAADRPTGESGFYVLRDGVDALAARLLLANRAERSIDAQYFLIHTDLTGTLFIDHLVAAAERGVRVRLLIDDILTVGDDAAIAALDSHPNFEIRIFNPFSHRSSARIIEFLTDFSRVDHRMHNKSFTVDNQVTVVGGRNIGDQYFDANREFEFADLDLAGFGPVAKQVSTAFDTYWNSKFAIPAGALVEGTSDPDAVQKLRQSYAPTLEAASSSTYRAAVDSTIVDNLLDPEFPLFWGTSIVVYDDPEKMEESVEEIVTVRSQLSPKVQAAKSELLLVSPYYVPLKAGVEGFRSLRNRDVRIVVFTNSLASTDMVPAHAGYSHYRKDLLEIGVEMYEVIPNVSFDEAKKSGYDFSHSALHMKAFVIDRRYVFVGSFNWDPRSSFINSEMGVFVDSPSLANWAAEKFAERLTKHAYRVRLDKDNEIEWVDTSGGDEVIYHEEPLTGTWRRLQAGFYGLLPIEGEL